LAYKAVTNYTKREDMKKFILPSLIFVVLFFNGCDDKAQLKKVDTDKKIDAITFTLQDPRGESLTVKEARDLNFGHDKEYSLVAFWATWCAPCKAEIPHLINIQNKYKDEVKVIAILAEQDKDHDEILEFIDEYNINYFVSNSDDIFAFANLIAKKIGLNSIRSIPTIALFRNGEYVSHWIGPAPEEMITAHIKSSKEG